MKRTLYVITLFLALANLFSLTAQETRIKKADKEYDNFSYMDAIVLYEKVFKKGYKSVEILENLGNAYYFNGEYADAAKWYSELFALEPEASNPEYYYRYSQSLKSIGDLEQSNEYLDKYFNELGYDARKTASKDYLDVIEENSDRFMVASAKELNTDKADYGAAFYEDNLVFASTRGRKSWLVFRTQSWSNQKHEALYISQIDEQGNLGEPKMFSPALNSRFSETTPAFTSDGKTIYFTRHNYLKRRGYDAEQVTRLKIYRAILENGKWRNITELPFNSDQYSVAHPALSPDEKTLYFTSDMPGGYGNSDIWKVAIHDDGTYGSPENLGPTVNTKGRETFPFVSQNNELYYSSNGKLGLGGLDIFVSKITEDGYEEAINLGRPVNGAWDDFAFYYDSEKRTGFFSSNRKGGEGLDDIYKFVETRPLIISQSIVGTITDAETGEQVADAIINLYDGEENFIGTTTTDEEGKYAFGEDLVKGNTFYRIRTISEEHNIEERSLTTGDVNGYVNVQDFEVKKYDVSIIPGTDLAKELNIPVIYFDFDKSNIRSDAAAELTKLLQVLEENPELKIEIRSHTDSRGSHEYNQKLSERRANSTLDWLVSQGISPDRLTAQGYGETQLVNDCSDGVWCSAEDHQLNRRSEFIIVE